jgi:hypothetical protein
VCGTFTLARLPLEPMATIVPLVHLARANVTVKRPCASAVAALLRGPTETTTCSPVLKPRPTIRKGFMDWIVSAGRPVSLEGAVELSVAVPTPNVISRTIRPISNTTPEV